MCLPRVPCCPANHPSQKAWLSPQLLPLPYTPHQVLSIQSTASSKLRCLGHCCSTTPLQIPLAFQCTSYRATALIDEMKQLPWLDRPCGISTSDTCHPTQVFCSSPHPVLPILCLSTYCFLIQECLSPSSQELYVVDSMSCV